MNIYFDNSGTYIKDRKLIIEISPGEAFIIFGTFVILLIIGATMMPNCLRVV